MPSTRLKTPRISTRSYYDLKTGKTLKNNDYFLYPKKSFQKLANAKELVIMIHGLRNDNAGAVAKIKIAKNRLRQLGYKHPVVGFSYDANTTGAHLKKYEKRSLRAGQIIAKKNGKHLAKFIFDFKKQNTSTKIRLLGHSLGTEVILSAANTLAKNSKNKNTVESVYFFGSSVTEHTLQKSKTMLQKIVNKKIVNYYSPHDNVLKDANERKLVINPIGLNGFTFTSKYRQKKVRPKNHRFASYALELKKFP